MYFKNLRSDRDGGTTGLIARGPRYRTGGLENAGGGSSATSYGGGGVGGGANSRNWFTGTGGAGVGTLLRSPPPTVSTQLGGCVAGVGGLIGGGAVAASVGVAAAAVAAAAASATGAGAVVLNNIQQHPGGGHLLMDLPSSRHQAETPVGYDELGDRGSSGGSRNSTATTATAANNRWNNSAIEQQQQQQQLQLQQQQQQSRSGGGDSSRADYRYQRVRGDSSVDSANAAGGSRSVRSGLYDTEVCLSVSGLGNVRGTMVSGRTGKQVIIIHLSSLFIFFISRCYVTLPLLIQFN